MTRIWRWLANLWFWGWTKPEPATPVADPTDPAAEDEFRRTTTLPLMGWVMPI
jgi:hypothetical protein